MKKQFLIILLLSLGLIGISSAGEVETNILRLKALNACDICNLQGANLTGAKLTEAILRNANITGTTLCNTETPWGIDDSGC